MKGRIAFETESTDNNDAITIFSISTNNYSLHLLNEHIKEKYNIEDCYTAYILWSSLSDTENGKAEFVTSKIPFFKKDNRLYAPIRVGQEWYLFEEYMYSNPNICKEVLSEDTIKIFDSLNTCDLYECTSLFFVKVILYRLGSIGTLIEEELKN